MEIGIVNQTGVSRRIYSCGEKEKREAAAKMEFAKSVNSKSPVQKESAVDQYKKKHPEDAAHVNGQVRAGKKVLSEKGVDVDSLPREDMTMEEYQNFIMGILNTIPFDQTRVGDREYISISEAGWEQMKQDPDYEAWVLGYTVENRSVRNPFAGWPGASGTYCVERFGASIEEHLGQSFPMNVGKSREPDDEESWWQKRHKRIEELMEEQVEQAQKRRAAQSARATQEYQRQVSMGRQRLREYLGQSASASGGKERVPLESSMEEALAAYESFCIVDGWSNLR